MVADSTAGPRQPLRTAAQVTADFLALSDERDQALSRSLDAWREGYTAAREDAYADGFVAGVAALKRQIRGDVDDFSTEMTRWHVCCTACRRAPRDKRRCVRDWHGCPRCEVRTRETFSLPHPDDFPGITAAEEAAA